MYEPHAMSFDVFLPELREVLFYYLQPLSLCSISNPHFVYAAVYQHDKQPTPPPVGTAGGCLEKLADLQKMFVN